MVILLKITTVRPFTFQTSSSPDRIPRPLRRFIESLPPILGPSARSYRNANNFLGVQLPDFPGEEIALLRQDESV
jgi:hypothetical protein